MIDECLVDAVAFFEWVLNWKRARAIFCPLATPLKKGSGARHDTLKLSFFIETLIIFEI